VDKVRQVRLLHAPRVVRRPYPVGRPCECRRGLERVETKLRLAEAELALSHAELALRDRVGVSLRFLGECCLTRTDLLDPVLLACRLSRQLLELLLFEVGRTLLNGKLWQALLLPHLFLPVELCIELAHLLVELLD